MQPTPSTSQAKLLKATLAGLLLFGIALWGFSTANLLTPTLFGVMAGVSLLAAGIVFVGG